MSILAQAGLGEIGRYLYLLSFITFWGSLFSFFLFLCLWYLPEIRQLISDKIRGTNPRTRGEEDRKLEGKLLNPDYTHGKNRHYSASSRFPNSASYRG